MKQIKILTYRMDLALSNKYLKVIIQCIEPIIFNDKVQVLFYKIKKSNKTSTLSLNILSSKHSIITYYFCVSYLFFLCLVLFLIGLENCVACVSMKFQEHYSRVTIKARAIGFCGVRRIFEVNQMFTS